jgi:hypothetical protein
VWQSLITLVAVIVGAATAGLAQWLRDRRAISMERVAAARMIREELAFAEGALRRSVTKRQWWSALQEDAWAQWAQHLAELPAVEWRAIRIAYTVVQNANRTSEFYGYPTPVDPLPDSIVEKAQEGIPWIVLAVDVLGGHSERCDWWHLRRRFALTRRLRRHRRLLAPVLAERVEAPIVGPRSIS